MRKSATRSLATTLVVIAALAVWAGSAAATSGAHFFSATGSVDNSGALVVTWDEAGVGQQQVDYTLTVTTATATYACINGGNNHPKASNKETFSSGLSTGGTFTPDNGRVTGSLSVGPVSAESFACPNGQRLVLASVSYSGITLTDTTNNVSTSVPDTSRTFFDI
jgi:hypothetical protein